MGILVGMGWIVLGVLYVIYKFGEEELSLGKSGGIGCVFAIIAGFLLLGGFAGICIAVTDNDAEASLLAWGIIIPILAAWILYCHKSSAQKEREQEQWHRELSECADISKTLPLPTRSQMAQFIDEIRNTEEPSEQQQIYRRMLQDADSNMQTPPIDAMRFKDMQAAWIYYSQNDSKSSQRKHEFGEQNLAAKLYFDPAIDRTGEPVTGRDMATFWELVKRIPLELKENWCLQPMFARKVFGMIEESIPISAETLYPVMLEAYRHPATTESEISFSHSMTQMECDLEKTWNSLIFKRSYVLAQVSIPQKEAQEWQKVEEFRLAIIPAIQEKQALTNEALFPVMLRIYNSLLEEDYLNNPRKYDFERLWHGLNSVGKAVGKEGSFFDYPRYVIEFSDTMSSQKMKDVFSQSSLSSSAWKYEWLKVDLFQAACAESIREKRYMNDDELFPIMYKTYNELLAANEFTRHPRRYNFVILWNGIYDIGKQLGKSASFQHYPKYIIEQDKEADHDHQ